MLSFSEAQAHIFALPFSFQQERISILQAHQRTVAQDIRAIHPLPRWSNSAMDGYAVDIGDLENLPTVLPITQVIPAGATHIAALKKGSCARILTGAPLPPNANTVIMQEDTQTVEEGIRFHHPPLKGSHCRQQGEEFAIGAILIPKGQVLQAADIALCVSAGIVECVVYQQPKIGIIATGDELKVLGETLDFGQIYSSNSISLQLALQEMHLQAIDYGIARDNLQSTKEVFSKAIKECDIIISTGGVSVGDFDVVHEALAEFDFQMNFWKVKMKPGKPIAAGMINHKPIFALPGNPVSCLMSFHQFVAPFLKRKMGHPQPDLPLVEGILTEDIPKKGDRLEFVRVILFRQNGETFIKATGQQSSAWLSSFTQATALLPIAEDCNMLRQGSRQSVMLLNMKQWQHK